jgi:hypothetical protein
MLGYHGAGGPRAAENYMLSFVEPGGEILGSYGGQPILEVVRDQFGRVYGYSGIAPRDSDGQYLLAALRPREFILPPGLVYCAEPNPPSWLKSIFAVH